MRQGARLGDWARLSGVRLSGETVSTGSGISVVRSHQRVIHYAAIAKAVARAEHQQVCLGRDVSPYGDYSTCCHAMIVEYGIRFAFFTRQMAWLL